MSLEFQFIQIPFHSIPQYPLNHKIIFGITIAQCNFNERCTGCTAQSPHIDLSVTHSRYAVYLRQHLTGAVGKGTSRALSPQRGHGDSHLHWKGAGGF